MRHKGSRREFLLSTLGTVGAVSVCKQGYAGARAGGRNEPLVGTTGADTRVSGKTGEIHVRVFPNRLGRPLRHLEVGGVPADAKERPSFKGPKCLGFIRHGGITQYMNHKEVFSLHRNRKLKCDWSEMDADIDTLLSDAIVVEPLFGYIPAILADHARCSQWGHSIGIHTSPPTDYKLWEEVCYQTVYHFNVERKLGIRYWEVWNEPNATGFWEAPFSEYLKLYDYAVRGAKRADPTVKVGGPTITVSGPAVLQRPPDDKFPPEMLSGNRRMLEEWAPATIPSHTNYHGESPFALIAGFIQHCGEKHVPLDFLTWHNYNDAPGMDPYDLSTFGRNIRLFRAWLDNYPQFREVKLVIDEWGILGDRGTLKTAIFHGSALIEMEKAGLAFQENYEVVDAQAGRAKPMPSEPSYWRKSGSEAKQESQSVPVNPVQNITAIFASLGRKGCEAVSSNPHVRVLASRDGDDVSVVVVRFEPGAAPVDVPVVIKPLPAGRSWQVTGLLLDAKHDSSLGELREYRIEKNFDGDTCKSTIRLEGLSAAAFKLTAGEMVRSSADSRHEGGDRV